MGRKNRIIPCATLAALLVAATGSMAADRAGLSPTNSTLINARTMNYDYQKRTAILKDDVIVVDPSIKIMSDEMVMTFTSSNTPEVITATGNVKIWQEERMAVCRKAIYTVKSGMLVLTGNPVLTRGSDHLTGQRIVFYRDSDKVIVDRPSLTITPGKTDYALPGMPQ